MFSALQMTDDQSLSLSFPRFTIYLHATLNVIAKRKRRVNVWRETETVRGKEREDENSGYIKVVLIAHSSIPKRMGLILIAFSKMCRHCFFLLLSFLFCLYTAFGICMILTLKQRGNKTQSKKCTSYHGELKRPSRTIYI